MDSSGWEDLPESVREAVRKGAPIFKKMEEIKNRTLLWKAVTNAWEGKDKVKTYEPLEDMTDDGLDKAVVILETVIEAVDVMRRKRAAKT